jgi:DNA ligase D
MAADDEAEFRSVAGQEIRISSPEKPYFPKLGLTKSDVVDYFVEVADALMNTMGNRPVLLQRFPNGVSGKNFFQKRIPDSAPDWLQTTTVETVNGTPSRAIVMADAAHLVWAANLGAFTLHPWPFRVPGEDVDELRVDLDPTPGITFDDVRHAAALTREELLRAGIDSYVKTSGSKGLHLYVPLAPGWNSYDVRGAAVTLARRLSARHPKLLTDAWWKEERGQRVFIDFNQNAPHKTVFGAWSIRARVGAQVSTPISWDELETVVPDELTVLTVPERLATAGDPWSAMYASPQDISELVQEFEAGLHTVGDAPWPPVYPKQPFEPSRVAPSRAKQPDEAEPSSGS